MSQQNLHISHRKGVAKKSTLRSKRHSAGPGDAQYRRDQVSQAEAQRLAREDVIGRDAAKLAKAIITERYAAADRTLEKKYEKKLQIIHDCHGVLQTPEWHVAELTRIETTREHFWEPRGKKRTGFKRQKIGGVRKGKKRADGTFGASTRGKKYYEWAFPLPPVLSMAFFFAADAGKLELARQLLIAYNLAFAALFRKLTRGAYSISFPLHPKFLITHPQPPFSLWSDPVHEPGKEPTGKPNELLACLKQGGSKVKNRLFKGLSLSIEGSLHQSALGLSVDELTGVQDAVEGANEILKEASAHQYPLNHAVGRYSLGWFKFKLKQPEWAGMLPYFNQARAEYLRRKEEQLGEVRAQVDAARKRDVELEKAEAEHRRAEAATLGERLEMEKKEVQLNKAIRGLSIIGESIFPLLVEGLRSGILRRPVSPAVMKYFMDAPRGVIAPDPRDGFFVNGAHVGSRFLLPEVKDILKMMAEDPIDGNEAKRVLSEAALVERPSPKLTALVAACSALTRLVGKRTTSSPGKACDMTIGPAQPDDVNVLDSNEVVVARWLSRHILPKAIREDNNLFRDIRAQHFLDIDSLYAEVVLRERLKHEREMKKDLAHPNIESGENVVSFGAPAKATLGDDIE